MKISTRKYTKLMLILIFLFVFIPSISLLAHSLDITIVTKHYKNIGELQYPYVTITEEKKAETKINQLLKKHIKQSFQNYSELMKKMEEIKNDEICKESPNVCAYEYVTNYEVKYNKNKLSILLNDYQFTGGAHGNTAIALYNFQTNDGTLLSLDDFFLTQDVYNKITAYSKNYMLQNPNIFYLDPKEFEDFQVTNKNLFYLADDGLYLIFQQYEVGPYVSGNPIIKIPKSLYE